MLYHYTIPAMRSILRDAGAKGQMCFWATRYDCFADVEEFKLGVETIRRLIPEVEKMSKYDFEYQLVSFEESLKRVAESLGK